MTPVFRAVMLCTVAWLFFFWMSAQVLDTGTAVASAASSYHDKLDSYTTGE